MNDFLNRTVEPLLRDVNWASSLLEAGFRPNDYNGSCTAWSELQEPLATGHLRIGVLPLWQIPTGDLNGLCIAALSRRKGSGWRAVNVSSGADMSGLGPSIAIPELIFHVDDTTAEILTRWWPSKVVGPISDAANVNRIVLLDYLLAKASDISDNSVFTLPPREYIPVPGSGIVALVCAASDLELRRSLAMLHCRETSKFSNVERRLAHWCKGRELYPLGVHMFKDASGRYVLDIAFSNADGGIRYFSWRHSTHSTLLEAARTEIQIAYDAGELVASLSTRADKESI